MIVYDLNVNVNNLNQIDQDSFYPFNTIGGWKPHTWYLYIYPSDLMHHEIDIPKAQNKQERSSQKLEKHTRRTWDIKEVVDAFFTITINQNCIH